MWTCRYCGGSKGMHYQDNQLEGTLCLEPDCGRFNNKLEDDEKIYDSYF